MTTTEILNQDLTLRLNSEYEAANESLTLIKSNNELINKSIKLASKMDLPSIEKSLEQRIRTIIPDWESYHARENEIVYDFLYFEYSDDSGVPYEANSYGIYDVEGFESTIESYDYNHEYKMGVWEAGVGFKLESFDLLEPFNYDKQLELELDEIMSSANSGYSELEQVAISANLLALHNTFMRIDAGRLLDKIGIKSGGLLICDLHDNGSSKIPFYIKK